MPDTITIGGAPVDINSEAAHAFIVDCVRAGEGLLKDSDLVEIYNVSPPELQALAKDAAFAKLIRNERDRRVRSGVAAREAASKHFIKAPNVLDSIMSDVQANVRHRIESIRELRQIALPESNTPAEAGDRFVITIDLGAGHIERYDEARAINVTPESKSIESEQPKLVEQPRRRGRPPKLKIVEQGSDDE